MVSASEVEATEVGAGVDFSATYADILCTLGNGLKHALVRVNIGVYLIHITHAHGLAYAEGTFVGLLHAHDHTEEGSLTSTIRTDDTYDAVRWEHKVEVLEEQFIAKGLANALCINNFVTQTWTVRDKYLELLLSLFLLLVEHAVVGSQTGFTFGLAGFRCHAHPFELALEGLTALAGLFLLHSHAGRLLLQP